MLDVASVASFGGVPRRGSRPKGPGLRACLRVCEWMRPTGRRIETELRHRSESQPIGEWTWQLLRRRRRKLATWCLFQSEPSGDGRSRGRSTKKEARLSGQADVGVRRRSRRASSDDRKGRSRWYEHGAAPSGAVMCTDRLGWEAERNVMFRGFSTTTPVSALTLTTRIVQSGRAVGACRIEVFGFRDGALSISNSLATHGPWSDEW